jgi:ankyrin repeat protein
MWRKILQNELSSRLQSHPEVEDALHGLGWTQLHECIRNNELSLLLRQLELDPQSSLLKDGWGATLLHWAANFANMDAIDMLVAAGADVNAVCKENSSVLHWALEPKLVQKDSIVTNVSAQTHSTVETGSKALEQRSCISRVTSDLVELLLCSGCDSKARDRFENTPLMLAAMGTSPAACLALLDWGADINTHSEHRMTALACAVQFNRHSNTRLLIDRGASLDARFRGPLVYHTVTAADTETVGILQKAGLEGLETDAASLDMYWSWLYHRKELNSRQHASEAEDIAAFQALLDSVTSRPDRSWTDTVKSFEVPGAYPEDRT